MIALANCVVFDCDLFLAEPALFDFLNRSYTYSGRVRVLEPADYTQLRSLRPTKCSFRPVQGASPCICPLYSSKRGYCFQTSAEGELCERRSLASGVTFRLTFIGSIGRVRLGANDCETHLPRRYRAARICVIGLSGKGKSKLPRAPLVESRCVLCSRYPLFLKSLSFCEKAAYRKACPLALRCTSLPACSSTTTSVACTKPCPGPVVQGLRGLVGATGSTRAGQQASPQPNRSSL